MKFIDLTNQRFGRLIVIEKYGLNKFNHILWLCLCDCGNKVVVERDCLKNGRTKSCGCIRKERNNNTRHGMTGTPIHNIWKSIKQRCLNPNNKDYKNYGGRGITVCNRWLKFENFYKDVGNPPKGLTLDRINNNGNYNPNNWRWATRQQQSDNKRRKGRR